MVTLWLAFTLRRELSLVVSLVKDLVRSLEKIKESDIKYLETSNRNGTIRLMISTVSPTLLATFFLVSGLVDEYLAQFYKSNVETALRFTAFFTTEFTIFWTSHFYLSIIRVGRVYAKNCRTVVYNYREKQKLMKTYGTERLTDKGYGRIWSGSCSLELKRIERILEKYFGFVRSVNKSLGLVPFLLFASLFG
jgi:hypothetical protein